MPQLSQFSGRTWCIEADVAPGAPETILLPAATPGVIAVFTDPTETALVEYTISHPDRVAAGTARWVPAATAAGSGLVPASSREAIVFDNPLTAIRITATGGVVAVEVQQ